MKKVEVQTASAWARDKAFLFSVQQFKKALEKIRKQEIDRHVKNASDSERKLMESFTNEYIRKIINVTDVQIRAMPENTDTEAISVMLAELFNSESRFLTKPLLKGNSAI